MPLSVAIGEWAARAGHLDCLTYVHECGVRLGDAASVAAKNGHLDCLTYAHTNGGTLVVDSMPACSPKQLACLEYAWEHKCVKLPPLPSMPTSMQVPMSALMVLLRRDDELKRIFDPQRWHDLESLYVRHHANQLTRKGFIEKLFELVGKPKVLVTVRAVQQGLCLRKLVIRHILLPKWRRAVIALSIVVYWRRASVRYVHKLKRAVSDAKRARVR